MAGYESLTDEELILRYRSGEGPVLDYLMEKYKGLVSAKARSLFLSGGDTEDLLQEGMIGLFKAVRDYQREKGASFLTFASLCIDRQLFHAIDHAGRQKNLPLNTYVPLPEEEALKATIHLANPEAIVLDQEEDSLLAEFLSKNLSRMERQVLGRFLLGESYAEIGRALGKEPKAIDNALQRIRRKMGFWREQKQ